jgi:hypothetical protein
MESNGIFGIEKIDEKFGCKFCHYKCFYNCDWVKHLSTTKHINNVKWNKNGIEESKKSKKSSDFICDCGRSYSTKSNLGKHKKTCQKFIKKNDEQSEEKLNINDLVKYLMKENIELKTLLIDHSNKIVSNNLSQITTQNNTTNNNSHNKAFNLNFFLNETCKNAMNITDFVESIKLQLSDFMDVGKVGYVEGISNIIVKKLNDLDETERPIHCTDQKRETFYVKDENKWEKEEEDLKNIRKMIKKVVRKNEGLMQEYKKEFPDYNDPESKRSDQYSKFVIEAMGGLGDNNIEKEEKIIKNISKNVTIKNKK